MLSRSIAAAAAAVFQRVDRCTKSWTIAKAPKRPSRQVADTGQPQITFESWSRWSSERTLPGAPNCRPWPALTRLFGLLTFESWVHARPGGQMPRPHNVDLAEHRPSKKNVVSGRPLSSGVNSFGHPGFYIFNFSQIVEDWSTSTDFFKKLVSGRPRGQSPPSPNVHSGRHRPKILGQPLSKVGSMLDQADKCRGPLKCTSADTDPKKIVGQLSKIWSVSAESDIRGGPLLEHRPSIDHRKKFSGGRPRRVGRPFRQPLFLNFYF